MSCSRRSAIGATATLIFAAALSQQIGVAAAEEPSSEEAVVPVQFFPGKGEKAGLVIFFDGDGQALHDTDGGDGAHDGPRRSEGCATESHDAARPEVWPGRQRPTGTT